MGFDRVIENKFGVTSDDPQTSDTSSSFPHHDVLPLNSPSSSSSASSSSSSSQARSSPTHGSCLVIYGELTNLYVTNLYVTFKLLAQVNPPFRLPCRHPADLLSLEHGNTSNDVCPVSPRCRTKTAMTAAGCHQRRRRQQQR